MLLGYADDLCVMAPNKRDLRRSLKIIKSWGDKNVIELNYSKCGIFRVMGRSTTEHNAEEMWKIPVVRHYKYLGITISNSLKLDEHFKNVEKKVMLFESFLNKIPITKVPILVRV